MEYELYYEGGDPNGNFLDMEYTLTKARSTAYDIVAKAMMTAKKKGINPAKVKGVDIYKLPTPDENSFMIIFSPYGTVKPDPRNPSVILWKSDRKTYVLKKDGTLRK